MNSIDVRIATEEEQSACVALLPNVRTADAEFLIARCEGRIVGAAVVRWINWNEPSGFPFTVEVVPEARRSGVGTALVERAVDIARNEAAGLWSIIPVSDHSDSATFLRACGFVPERRSLHFRMDTAAFDDHMTAIISRLRQMKRVPSDMRTISLRNSSLDDVATMVSQSFYRGPERLLSLLRKSLEDDDSNRIDLDLSVVVMYRDEVAGAIFGRWNSGRCLIEANVVAPAFRKSSVNALQLAASVRNIRDHGSREFLFQCEDDVIDSINLAKRSGGEHVATDILFRYPLDRR